MPTNRWKNISSNEKSFLAFLLHFNLFSTYFWNRLSCHVTLSGISEKVGYIMKTGLYEDTIKSKNCQTEKITLIMCGVILHDNKENRYKKIG